MTRKSYIMFILNKDSKNLGYLFEHVIFEKLKSMDLFDEIHYEKELIKRYGWNACSIDYLLVYKDTYIVIQLKWVKTKRRETHAINNFIKSVEYLRTLFNTKKMICGLWVSRRKPFQDNEFNLNNRNIFCVSEFDNMSKAADQTERFIKKVVF